ncbi:hypothetical protein BDQ17DRAFT_1244622, partial [Cyathus striatus]
SQCQTISNILVDIGSLPCGKLSLFHLYVILSRKEDDQLERLDAKTKVQWERIKKKG